MAQWCRAQPVPRMSVEVRRLAGADAAVAGGCSRRAARVRIAVRASGQAAGIYRLAAGLGTLGARDSRRQTLWTGRRGRRICRIQLSDGDRRAQSARGAAAALCADDRGNGGERQHSLARAPRCVGSQNRRAFLGGLSRCGMRQLRAAVDDHVAARQFGRQAESAGSDGGRAFRPGIRHRAHAVSAARTAAGAH